MMKTIRLFVLSLLCLAMSLPVNAQEQTAEKKYDIVVARDGSGDFRNIQDAIESIRAFKPGKRTTVFIKKGVYKEKIKHIKSGHPDLHWPLTIHRTRQNGFSINCNM